MKFAELVAFAVQDPAAASPLLAAKFREQLRTVKLGGTGEHPFQVSSNGQKNEFQLSLQSPSSSTELSFQVDLKGLTELLSTPQGIFERLGASLDERTGRFQLGLYRPDGSAVLRTINDIEASPHLTHTDVEERLASQISGSETVLVVGPSASGKTTCVAAACRSIGSQRRAHCAYFDLASGLPQSSQLLQFALQQHSEPLRERVVIFDNVQSQISAVPLLHEILQWSRSLGPIAVILVAWPSARNAITAMFADIAVFGISGDRVISEINSHLPAPLPTAQLTAVQRIAQGDVLVGQRLINAYKSTGQVLGPEQLQDTLMTELGVAHLSVDAIECMRDICRINALDIPVKRAYLEAKHGKQVDLLMRTGLLKQDGNFLRVGHRSRARLVFAGLGAIMAIRVDTPDRRSDEADPNEIIRYFRTLRRDELYQTLTGVDAVLAEAFSQSVPRVKFSGLLRLISALIRQLELAQHADPTWGNNLASAVFAGMAFSWGAPAEWHRIAPWIRAKAGVRNGELEFPNGVCAARSDFDLIKQAMEKEETRLGQNTPTYWESSEVFDPNAAYRNWVAGLLLCFEGSSLEQDGQRQTALVNFISARGLTTGGVYPRRVPWITARVLLGLGACGESVETSSLARSSAEWLLGLENSGKIVAKGLWPSGTGQWNAPEQCTALVVAALRAVGVPHDRIQARFDIELLKNKLTTFNVDSDEIDILLILECISEFEDFGSDSESLLNLITERYSDSARVIVESLDAKKMREESSKIPFVVNSLLNILWDRLSKSLVTAFLGEEPHQPPMAVPQAIDNFIFEAELLIKQLSEIEQEKRRSLVRAHTNSVPASAISQLEVPVLHLKDAVERLKELLATCIDSIDGVGRSERLISLGQACSQLRVEFALELRAV